MRGETPRGDGNGCDFFVGSGCVDCVGCGAGRRCEAARCFCGVARNGEAASIASSKSS